MTSRSISLANSAGAAPSAPVERSGDLIFETDESHGTGPPVTASSGGAGRRPPGQVGGSIVGAAGGDGDDGDESSIELVLEPADATSGDSSAGTIVMSAQTVDDLTLLSEEAEPIPAQFFEGEVPADAPLAVLGPAEEAPRFGRWDLAVCLAMVISFGAMGTAFFQIIVHSTRL